MHNALQAGPHVSQLFFVVLRGLQITLLMIELVAVAAEGHPGNFGLHFSNPFGKGLLLLRHCFFVEALELAEVSLHFLQLFLHVFPCLRVALPLAL